MCLIDGVAAPSSWTEHDSELLKTLYSEKHCSVEILAQVFQLSPEEIASRLANAGLDIIIDKNK